MLSLILGTLSAMCLAFLTGLTLRLSVTPRPPTLPGLLERLFAREIAHRGGSLDAPENTMCAFRRAVERGVKALEIDIQITADMVPIVLHDETLDRTTNGTGAAADMTLEQILKLNANQNFPDIGECRVPTLDETVRFAIEHDVALLMDVKGGPFCKQFSAALTRLKREFPEFRNFAVISFFTDVLYTVRRDHPEIPIGFTRRHDHLQNIAKLAGRTSPPWQTAMFTLDRLYDFLTYYLFVPWLRVDMLETRKDDVSESYVRDVAPRPLLVWTVNDPLEKKYFKHLGCAVMTDRVDEE